MKNLYLVPLQEAGMWSVGWQVALTTCAYDLKRGQCMFVAVIEFRLECYSIRVKGHTWDWGPISPFLGYPNRFQCYSTLSWKVISENTYYLVGFMHGRFTTCLYLSCQKSWKKWMYLYVSEKQSWSFYFRYLKVHWIYFCILQ